MKIDRNNPRHWFLLVQQWLYTIIAIGVRFFRGKPRRPLVILYGHQLSGNLKALYSEWQKSNQADMDMYFLSLDPLYSDSLEQVGTRVLRCNRLWDMLKLSQASAMITDHGLHVMTPLLRFTDIIFIDVWHGIPFKGFVPEDFKLQHRYDEVWVSSPLLKKIYEEKFGFDPQKVANLGYARTDKLFKPTEPDAKLEKVLHRSPSRKNVLYAPTWQQDDRGRELFPFGESEDSFLSTLSEICSSNGSGLIVRSHLNEQMNQKGFDNVLYLSQRDYADTEELLLASDVLICDWSSIAFDFLAMNRPTIFLDVPPPFKNGFTLGKDYRFGNIAGSLSQLGEALEIYLKSPEHYFDTYQTRQNNIIYDVYGRNIDGLAAQRQLKRVIELAKAGD